MSLKATASRIPDPSSMSEAVSQEDANEWKDAVKFELESLRQHKTWEVVARPEGAKVLSARFVFLPKYNERCVVRHKARLVVRGIQHGTVDQTLSRVVDFTTVRTCRTVAVQKGYVGEHLDMKTAFLHGDIDADVYITPPQCLDLCHLDELL